MWKFLTRLFKKQVVVHTNAEAIPQAFGYPYAEYDKLVNEMFNVIKDESRYPSFDNFIHSEKLRKYNLDVDNPRDALLVGYAFCTALMLQRSIRMREAANSALDAFYPNKRSKN